MIFSGAAGTGADASLETAASRLPQDEGFLNAINQVPHPEVPRRWFYHLNLRAPCRSTLADANAERPASVFRDIAMALVPVAAGALRGENAAFIRLLDSTPIPLKGDGFAWARPMPAPAG